MCLVVWKRTFYGNIDLSTTFHDQCRQVKLNPMSTQINIHCLMTNQRPALLVQRAPWTRAAVLLLQSLYFSRPPPHQSYNPRHPPPFPLGTFENQDVAVTVRRGISKRSHEKIGDCEQSNSTHIYGMQHNLRLFQKTFSGYKHREKKRVISLCRKRSTNPYKKTVHSLRLARPWLILTPPPPPPPCMISLLLSYYIMIFNLQP